MRKIMDPAAGLRTLKPIDAMWLHLESSVGTTLVAGLMLFETPVDFARLRDQVTERLLSVERLRQRPRPTGLPLSLPAWEPVPDFDLDDHLHRSKLPEPAAWPQLSAFIEALLTTPLPRERPLWQMHLIERYGSGSALVICFSHVIADGFAAMHLLEVLTDAAPGTRPQADPTLLGRGTGLAAPRDAGRAALRLPVRLLRGRRDVALDPVALLRVVSWQMQEIRQLAGYALRPPGFRFAQDGRSARATLGGPGFAGTRGTPAFRAKRATGATRVAATEPLPLAEVKAVAKALGGSVNDVLTAAVAGGLRRYLANRGTPVDRIGVQAAMAYNLRTPERRGELGNAFSLAFLPLPVSTANPGARLRAVQRQIGFVKSRPALPVGYVLASAASLLPAPLARWAMRFYLSKVTLVLTNVRGGPEPRYLAGQRIDRILFWVPLSGLATLVVSILSYAGQVTVCFDGDAQAVPDLDTLPAHFAAAWSDLQSLPDIMASS